jgi:hypothetical protein
MNEEKLNLLPSKNISSQALREKKKKKTENSKDETVFSLIAT